MPAYVCRTWLFGSLMEGREAKVFSSASDEIVFSEVFMCAASEVAIFT